jgi:alanyl-tRNA synthetase
MSRIFFKCGSRALLDLRHKTDIVKTLNQEFSSDDSTLLERFYAEKEKNEQLKKSYVELSRKQIDRSIDEQLIEGKTCQTLIFDQLSGQDMNYVIKKVSEKINVVLLVYSKSAKKVMLSHDGSFDVKCNELFKEIKSYGGKGGGSQKVAQGMFSDEVSGLNFIAYLKEGIDV